MPSTSPSSQPTSGPTQAPSSAPTGSPTGSTVLCAENKYVSSNTCVNCLGGSTNEAGDDPSGDDTTCSCAQDQFVLSNVCTDCGVGETNVADNPVPGPNTFCDRVETAGSSCTIFEGATGATGDPFFVITGTCNQSNCCQAGNTCKNGFNGCSAGIATNDACLAEHGALCTGLTPQCCKTANNGPYACQASGSSCP